MLGHGLTCGSVTGEHMGAMLGHELTCGSVTGEHMRCNARTWVNLWVCGWGTQCQDMG